MRPNFIKTYVMMVLASASTIIILHLPNGKIILWLSLPFVFPLLTLYYYWRFKSRQRAFLEVDGHEVTYYYRELTIKGREIIHGQRHFLEGTPSNYFYIEEIPSGEPVILELVWRSKPEHQATFTSEDFELQFPMSKDPILSKNGPRQVGTIYRAEGTLVSEEVLLHFVAVLVVPDQTGQKRRRRRKIRKPTFNWGWNPFPSPRPI